MRFYSAFLSRFFLFTFAFLFLGIQQGLADFRIGWKNQADLAKFEQVRDKPLKIDGTRVTWIPYDDDYKAMHDLAVNKLDAVPVDMISFLSAVTVGLQVRVIAIHQQYGKETGLFVRDAAHIDTPQKLIGAKIAVPFMTSSHYSLLRALDHWHIPVDKVQIVNMKPDAILKAWQQGTIEGAYMDGITVGTLTQKGTFNGHALVNSAQLAEWGYPTYQFWVVMDETISKTPEITQAFIDKDMEAIADFQTALPRQTPQSPEIVKIATLLKQTPDTIDQLYKMENFPALPQQAVILSRSLPKEMNQVSLFLRSQKIMDNSLSDYLIYIYGGFITAVKAKR